ncbi:MAG TPA: hypothetical protein VMX15_03750, partial [Candidatus Heimdallarchaeota archaeon]|nr:hypothetical protein [Candidatus Heimdallarchaeota archaeon]
MRKRAAVLVVIGCLVAIGLPAWSEQEGFTSPLCEVLKLVPALATSPMISFTNWSLIKAYLGMESVSSKSPEEERLALLQTTFKGQYDPSGYASTLPTQHAEQWGFDKTDLAWEANILSRELLSVYILKFAPEFDFDPLVSLFLEREYVQTVSQAVALYMHELDPSAEWLRVTKLSMQNVAVIPDEDLLILSSSAGSVEALLATHSGVLASLSESPAAVATVDRLGETAGAILLLGLDTCLGFTQSPLLDLLGELPEEEVVEKLKALVADPPAFPVRGARRWLSHRGGPPNWPDRLPLFSCRGRCGRSAASSDVGRRRIQCQSQGPLFGGLLHPRGSLCGGRGRSTHGASDQRPTQAAVRNDPLSR